MSLYVTLSLILAGVCVGLPFVYRCRENLIRSRMKRMGRFMPWEMVDAKLRAGIGTIILNRTQQYGGKVWWTANEKVSNADAFVDAISDAYLTDCSCRLVLGDLKSKYPKARGVEFGFRLAD